MIIKFGIKVEDVFFSLVKFLEQKSPWLPVAVRRVSDAYCGIAFVLNIE